MEVLFSVLVYFVVGILFARWYFRKYPDEYIYRHVEPILIVVIWPFILTISIGNNFFNFINYLVLTDFSKDKKHEERM